MNENSKDDLWGQSEVGQATKPLRKKRQKSEVAIPNQ